jgi:hypothetical protein
MTTTPTMTPEELAAAFAADQRTLPAIVAGLATAVDMSALSTLKWLLRTAQVAESPMGLLLLRELGLQAAISLAVMAQPPVSDPDEQGH